MKRQFIITAFVIFLSMLTCDAVAHKQNVHQYFVRQGYLLLKSQLPQIANSPMDAAVGDPSVSLEIGDYPWQKGKIITGAWREDEEDPVYLYEKDNPPTITGLGGLISGFVAEFGGITPDAFVSSTHFWRADDGDNHATDMEGTYAGIYWKFTVPNSYQKMRAYAYGEHTLHMMFPNTATFQNLGQGTVLVTQLDIRYASLAWLYNSGNVFVEGYRDFGLVWHDVNDSMTIGSPFSQGMAWQILGRMAHLLGDLSVPAHAHGDAHGSGDDGIRGETYEDWVGDDGTGAQYQYWNYQNVGSYIDPYVSNDPLKYLWYTMQEMSDHFGSNGPYNGDGNNLLPESTGEYEFLTSLIGSEGSPTGQGEFTNDSPSGLPLWKLQNVRDQLEPYVIRATAGLLYWFAVETGILKKIVVQNDFLAGEVKFNYATYPSGSSFVYPSGQSIVLDVTQNPQFQLGYQRYFYKWQKVAGGNAVLDEYFATPASTVVDADVTYIARYNRQFNLSVNTAAYVEPYSGDLYKINGTNVGSSWSGSYIEIVDPPITLQAVPSAGYVLLSWSDGDLDNPRVLTPTDHTAVYAIYKAHLASNDANAISSNSQRKLARNNVLGIEDRTTLAYESAGSIFSTHSTDNGSTWSTEFRVSGSPTLGIACRGASIEPLGNAYGNSIITWEEYGGSGSTWSHTIKSDQSSLYPTIDAFTSSSDIPATPVMTSVYYQPGSEEVTCFYKDANGIRWANMDPNTYHTIEYGYVGAGASAPTTVNSYNPAAATRIINNFGQWCVVWEERGSPGKLQYAQTSLDVQGNIVWTVSTIATGSSTEENANPSIAIDAQGRACIAWAYKNIAKSSGSIKFQRRDASGSVVSGSQVELGYSVGSYPEGPSLAVKGYDAELVWYDPVKGLVRSHFNGNDQFWTLEQILSPSGRHASVELSRNPGSGDPLLVYTGSTGSPLYAISSASLVGGTELPPAVATVDVEEPVGWNMASIPVAVPDFSRYAVYPTVVSDIWFLQGQYHSQYDLALGRGYWVKYPEYTIQSYTGDHQDQMRIGVQAGWNMVGSISTSLDTANISTSPPGIKQSDYFAYHGGYEQTGVLQPGEGYWVKVTQAGELLLNVTGSQGTRTALPPTGAFGVPPAQDTLLSPSTGSTTQPPTLTLAWKPISNATSYHLQVAMGGFGSPLIDSFMLTNTSLQVGPLEPGTQYSWRVCAANSDGEGPWSLVWNFTTQALPATPSLSSPVSGATGLALSPVVAWNAAASADRYRLQVSTNSSFSTLVFDDTSITGTARQVGVLTSGTLYYWRVRAVNTAGTSSWSTVWSFTTGSPPPAPMLASPANGSTNQSITPTLAWNALSGGPFYLVQLSTSSSFSVITASQSTDATSWQPGPLNNSTQYYWRVRATNDIGTGSWSANWSFTTVAPPPVIPAAPVLNLPANGAIDQGVGVSLQWYASSYATSYRVQVSTNPGFGSFVADISNITETHQSMTGLLDFSTLYYWRANAGNVTGTSPWSTVRSFTTKDPDPPPCEGYSASTPMMLDQITLADAHGNHQTMYLENEQRPLMHLVGIQTDELPPEPVAEAVSMRFQSGKFIEHVPQGQGPKMVPILIREAAFPITLRWNLHADNAITYYLAAHGNEGRVQLAGDTGSALINRHGRNDKGDDVNAVIVLEATASMPCEWTRATPKGKPKEESDEAKPRSYALSQNYPNPFNPVTEIKYDLPEAVHVTLKVYNMLGQEVISLINGFQEPGYRSIRFDAGNLSSGVYFYRMQAGSFTQVMKMIITK